MRILCGECKRCGRCCESPDATARCENLTNEGLCGVWDNKYPNMPIRMLRADGSLAYESACADFSWQLEYDKPLILPPNCGHKILDWKMPNEVDRQADS